MEYRGQRRSHSYFNPNQTVRSQSQSQLYLLHDVDSDLSSAKNNDTNTKYVEFTRRYEERSDKKIETWKAKKCSFNECVTDELQKWKKEYEYTVDSNTNTYNNFLHVQVHDCFSSYLLLPTLMILDLMSTYVVSNRCVVVSVVGVVIVIVILQM